jgi:hypothetical protein
MNGQPVADRDFPGPGLYTISGQAPAAGPNVNVTLSVDKTYTATGDARNLGVVVTGIGFREKP